MHFHCWKVSQNVSVQKSKEKTTVLNQITPNDCMLLEHPVSNKRVIVEGALTGVKGVTMYRCL